MLIVLIMLIVHSEFLSRVTFVCGKKNLGDTAVSGMYMYNFAEFVD